MAVVDYTSITYVQSLIPRAKITSTHTPTATQIASFIPVVSGMIDARLSSVGINVPITTSATNQGYLFIKHLASLKVACITIGAAVGNNQLAGNYVTSNYCNEFETQMQKIEDNPNMLTGLLDGKVSRTVDSYELEYPGRALDYTDEPFIANEKQW